MANQEHVDKLMEGAEAWNKWREENPNVDPNLSEERLLIPDLTGADLTHLRLTGADLRGADLTDANLEHAKLTGAKLREANLTRVNLNYTELVKADLTEADLTNATSPTACSIINASQSPSGQADSPHTAVS